MAIFFTIFRHLTELWVPFSGDFSEFPELRPRFSFDLRNYDPKIHQNLRNYGYQFFGQNGTSLSDDRSRYPSPPPEVKKFTRLVSCEIKLIWPIFKTKMLIYQAKARVDRKFWLANQSLFKSIN